MSDWSKDIDLEAIKEYLQECAENDDYHYEQYQVDIVMHEYIRQKQVIQSITNENERLNNIIKDIKSQLDYLETYSSLEEVFDDMQRRLDRIDKIIGSEKE